MLLLALLLVVTNSDAATFADDSCAEVNQVAQSFSDPTRIRSEVGRLSDPIGLSASASELVAEDPDTAASAATATPPSNEPETSQANIDSLGVKSTSPQAGSNAFLTTSDWSQFWPSVVATALGALLALVSAIGVEQLVRRTADQRERANRQRRRIELRELVVSELGRNRQALAEIESSLERPGLLSVTPVLDVWRALSPEIINSSLHRDLPTVYYALDRSERLLTIYGADLRAGPEGTRRARTHTAPELRALAVQTRELIDAVVVQLAAARDD